MDQLSLQAFVYSRKHPRFEHELNDALASGLVDNEPDDPSANASSRTGQPTSTSGRGSGPSMLSADALRTRLQGQHKPSDKAAADNRFVMLLEGRLLGEDPAVQEPLIVHWSEEEEGAAADQRARPKQRGGQAGRKARHKDDTREGAMHLWREGRSRAEVRAEAAARSSARAASGKQQQAGNSSSRQGAPSEDSTQTDEESDYDFRKDRDFTDDGWYASNESALSSWLGAQSMGRLPLPGGAPRGRLLFRPDAPTQAIGPAAAVPDEFGEEVSPKESRGERGSTQGDEGALAWKLPWALV